MNSTSTSTSPSTLVWDLPLRVFHWLLVASFAAAYLLGEIDALRAAHALIGYTVAALLLFRLLWGVIGTRYARFAQWPLAPAAVARYLRSLLARRPEHHVGHNPAGSWAALALLALLAGTAASGAAVHNEIGPEWLEELHEVLANATLALVVVHVTAVVLSSLLHRQNLVRAMWTGRKPVDAPAAHGTRAAVALLLLAAVAALWAGLLPLPGIAPGTTLTAAVTKPSAPAQRVRREPRDDD